MRLQPRLRRRGAARDDEHLNFGNPESPTSPGSSRSPCAALATPAGARRPVVGGNVSLYNESPAGPIYPTPVIGMVGRLPDVRRAGRLGFRTRR